LTWDELLAPPDDLGTTVERRRAEYERLREVSVPATISVTADVSAIKVAA